VQIPKHPTKYKMEESIGFRSSRCWKCLVLSVLFIALAQIQECLSLPVPKYTRAISHHYNTNNNNKLFSKVKSYPDIIFDTEPLKRAYGDSLTLRDEAPLIDIYNDRIYFRGNFLVLRRFVISCSGIDVVCDLSHFQAKLALNLTL
jgi:hypothetical protein